MSSDQTPSGLVEEQGLGEEPLYHFTRIFLLYYQGIFGDMPTGSYKWKEDEKLSEIVIVDQVPIPRTRIEQKPAIVTMRGPAQYGNLSLDNVRTLDSRTGTKERTDLVACTMTLNCILRNDVEAQRIAWIVMRFARQGKSILQKAGIHKIGDEVQMGPISPPGTLVSGEADPDMVMVSVYVPFFFQWTERETPLNASVLRGAELRLRSALLPQAATTTAGSVAARTALRPPSIRGRVLNEAQTDYERLGEITQTVKT